MNGGVYNITPYLNYHPGGAKILVACAGRDATAEFNKYHAWVNLAFLLGRYRVGTLVEDEEVTAEASPKARSPAPPVPLFEE